MFNLESLLVTDNQNRGTPTLAGASEGKFVTTTNSILGLFGKAADTYSSVKNSINGVESNGAARSNPNTPATVAKTFLQQYGLWIGVGVVAVVAVFFVSRR